jgi:hypothetical protein
VLPVVDHRHELMVISGYNHFITVRSILLWDAFPVVDIIIYQLVVTTNSSACVRPEQVRKARGLALYTMT